MPSLAQLLRAASVQRAPFDLRAACAIATQICGQLDEPHGALSPSAIQVGWDGVVTLERSNRAASAALSHMAPERLAGSAPNLRSDLYSLGSILFEMVAGRALPREETTILQMLVLETDGPIEFLELIERSTAREASLRHASPREMAAWLSLASHESGGSMSRIELSEWLSRRFPRAPSLTTGSPSASPRRGLSWRFAAGAGLLASVGLLIAAAAAPSRDHASDAAGSAAASAVPVAERIRPTPPPVAAIPAVAPDMQLMGEPGGPTAEAPPPTVAERDGAEPARERREQRAKARRRAARANGNAEAGAEREGCPLAAAKARQAAANVAVGSRDD